MLSHVTFVDDILVVSLFIGYLIFYAPCRSFISLYSETKCMYRLNIVHVPQHISVFVFFFLFKCRRHSKETTLHNKFFFFLFHCVRVVNVHWHGKTRIKKMMCGMKASQVSFVATVCWSTRKAQSKIQKKKTRAVRWMRAHAHSIGCMCVRMGWMVIEHIA